jgi:hypothetical protein
MTSFSLDAHSKWLRSVYGAVFIVRQFSFVVVRRSIMCVNKKIREHGTRYAPPHGVYGVRGEDGRGFRPSTKP